MLLLMLGRSTIDRASGFVFSGNRTNDADFVSVINGNTLLAQCGSNGGRLRDVFCKWQSTSSGVVKWACDAIKSF